MNRINSFNKQGSQHIDKHYVKQMIVNNIDILKSLKDVKNININDITKISYSELVKLRDTKLLSSGNFYRIIDYVTEVDTSYNQCFITGVRSAHHQFDVIVLAIDNKTLSEDAYACIHDGDQYFKNVNFNKWKLKYSLDNNRSYFPWCSVNGKGVIYSLTDERNTVCDYDFKNIQYKRDNEWKNKYGESANFISAEDDYYYTFSYITSDNKCLDYSITDVNVLDVHIKGLHQNNRGRVALLNNVFIANENIRLRICQNVNIYNGYANTFAMNNCHNIDINSNFCYNNVFLNAYDNGGTYCVTIKNLFINNIFKNACNYNTFLAICCDNNFEKLVQTFKVFGQFNNNTCNDRISFSTISGSCSNNTFNGFIMNLIVNGYLLNCTIKGNTQYLCITGVVKNNTINDRFQNSIIVNINDSTINAIFGSTIIKISNCTLADIMWTNIQYIENCNIKSNLYYCEIKDLYKVDCEVTGKVLDYTFGTLIGNTQQLQISPLINGNSHHTISQTSNSEVIDYCEADIVKAVNTIINTNK